MYGSPARMRVEREVARRSNAPVVISTLLSLLVVGAAVAAVAYLVLRSPSSAVDSAERLEPVGTALPAPSEPPTLPTSVPTSEPDSEARPEPTALGFTGDAPAVAGLPTVAAPQEAGPTPTPRVIALADGGARDGGPTATDLAARRAGGQCAGRRTGPGGDGATSRADGSGQPVPGRHPTDPGSRGGRRRPIQHLRQWARVGDRPGAERRPGAGAGTAGRRGSERESGPDTDNTVIVPAPVITDDGGRDGSVEVVMPDVDAMIDEITARATDPNRNPNVGNAGRGNSGRAQGNDDPVVVQPRAEPAQERSRSQQKQGADLEQSLRA